MTEIRDALERNLGMLNQKPPTFYKTMMQDELIDELDKTFQNYRALLLCTSNFIEKCKTQPEGLIENI